MLLRRGIAAAAAGVALASCCFQVTGFDQNTGTSTGGATANSSGGSLASSSGGATSSSTGSGSTTGGGACHAGVSRAGFVTTLAGEGDGGILGLDGLLELAASEAIFGDLEGVASDSSGNVYVSDYGYQQIDKIDCAGQASIVSPAPAQLPGIAGIAVDSAGNVYVADKQFNAIRKIDPGGHVSIVAGNGFLGWADGTGGVGGSAEFAQPQGVAVDARGNLFVADTGNNRIRKIDTSGNVTTLAGDGDAGYFDGTGGPNGTAEFNWPVSVAVDASGVIYVDDWLNYSIRQVDPAGNVTTLAGHSSSSSGSVDGTGGPNGTARFGSPLGVAVDGSGNVYVADEGCACIRKIDANANVTTFAGNGTAAYADGTFGPTGTAEFGGPNAIAVDGKGNLYVSDIGSGRIRMITP